MTINKNYFSLFSFWPSPHSDLCDIPPVSLLAVSCNQNRYRVGTPSLSFHPDNQSMATWAPLHSHTYSIVWWHNTYRWTHLSACVFGTSLERSMLHLPALLWNFSALVVYLRNSRSCCRWWLLLPRVEPWSRHTHCHDCGWGFQISQAKSPTRTVRRAMSHDWVLKWLSGMTFRDLSPFPSVFR